jgi:hypothetical protein
MMNNTLTSWVNWVTTLKSPRNKPAAVENATGLAREQIQRLCATIHSRFGPEERTWPPILELFKSVQVTLTYLRRNRVHADLAETFGVSQPTIGRAVATITPLIATVLADLVPVAEDLRKGEHHTTGPNVQVAATLSGRLAWISDPVDGSRHDTYALDAPGVLDTLDPADRIAEKGYQHRPTPPGHRVSRPRSPVTTRSTLATR